ncbi:hypothetical protein OSTOST_02261 [Ostertagia ostertagi]
MMKMVEPFMHPSNESSHTLLVLVFLQNVLQETVNRYKEERIKKHKRKVPKEYFLTDEDIVQFTEAILPSLLYAMYTKDGVTSKAPSKLVMILCALCPGRVFPKVFEHIYPAIFAVEEPHRLTQTLSCLFELVFLISQDNDPNLPRIPMEKDWISEMEEIRSPNSPIGKYSLSKLGQGLDFEIRDHLKTFRCHLFYLVEMLIEAIDINDVEKANIAIQIRSPNSPIGKYSLSKLGQGLDFEIRDHLKTFRCHLFYLVEMLIEAIDINDVEKANIAIQNLTMIFYMVPILDYSDCIKHHKLTFEEQALCRMSARLPVLAEMALDK